MKNVAIFGASGMTGLCVVNAALDKGLKVRVLLKDPSKLPRDCGGRVDVVEGDVSNIVDVKNTLEGQDSAIVVLGADTSLGPTTVISEGVKNIITVMESSNIKVISVCLSMFLFSELDKVPQMFREVTLDHRRTLKALDSSGLHWIAVNTSHIVDQPATGYTTKQGANTRYMTVSRCDLAKFLVDSLYMPEYYQKSVGIGSKTIGDRTFTTT